MIRVAALLVALAITAPSVAAVVCEVTCASEQSAPPAETGTCHGHEEQAPEQPTLEAGHDCHDIADPASLSVPVTKTVVAVPAAMPVVDAAPNDRALLAARARTSPATDHGPPIQLIPLRI